MEICKDKEIAGLIKSINERPYSNIKIYSYPNISKDKVNLRIDYAKKKRNIDGTNFQDILFLIEYVPLSKSKNKICPGILISKDYILFSNFSHVFVMRLSKSFRYNIFSWGNIIRIANVTKDKEYTFGIHIPTLSIEEAKDIEKFLVDVYSKLGIIINDYNSENISINTISSHIYDKYDVVKDVYP